MRKLSSFDTAPLGPIRRRLRSWLLPALLALGAAPAARAQCSFSVSATPAGPVALCAGGSTTLTAAATEPGFNVGGLGFNGVVYSVLALPDGKAIVGGQFNQYNGVAVPHHLVRLNADGSRDASFNGSNFGIDASGGSVRALAVQADGKLLVGGDFSTYNGLDVPDDVIRLNTDGSRDLSFNGTNAGFSAGNIVSLIVQPDGKILVGGGWSNYNGVTVPLGILRLNADGSRDTGFNGNNYGASGRVDALALRPDGKVLVGGTVNAYNSPTTSNVTRGLILLNSDGSHDATFNFSTNPGCCPGLFYGQVYALVLQPDGKILVGGALGYYNSAGAPSGVMRLNADGSLDASFNGSGQGFTVNFGTGSGIVYTLALQPDGKVLAGGAFNDYNLSEQNGGGVVPNHLVRLNANGSRDTGFNGFNTGLDNYVFSLALLPGGKVLAGGFATAYNGAVSAPDYVVSLNADGSLNNTAATPPGVTYTWSNGATGATLSVTQPGTYTATATSSGCTSTSNAVTVNAAPAVTVSVTPAGPVNLPSGGSQTLTATAVVPGFAQTGTGLNATVYAQAVQPDGKVLVAGNFSAYNGTPVGNLARLNADGTLDASFTSLGTGSSRVSVITLQPDGKILIGGGFATYGGVLRNSIARLNADGTLDTSFVPQGTGGIGLNGAVNAIVVQPDGKIVVGGAFDRFDNAPADRYIARFNANGSMDASFAPTDRNVNNRVFALALQPDGRILAGGDFTEANVTSFNNGGTARPRIVRLLADGLIDPSFGAAGQGFNGSVNAILVQPDGKVLVGGDFEQFATTTRGGIARLNADGTLDTGFVPAGAGLHGNSSFNDGVLALGLQADGKVLAGGSFWYYGTTATSRNALARLNPDGTLDTSYVPAGFPGTTINSLTVLPTGKLLAGGAFTAYGSTFVNRLMRLNSDASLDNAATPIAGATYTWSGGTTGATLSVSTAGSYTATATDPATGCQYTSNPVVVTAPAPDLVVSTTAGIPAGTYNNVTVTGTGIGTLQGNVTVNGALLVQTGGQLLSGCFIIDGPGSFTLAAGATLGICDQSGITQAGPNASSGLVRVTGLRTYSDDANYLYNGTVAQQTGDGLPITVRSLTVDNPAGVGLSRGMSVRRQVTLAGAGDLRLLFNVLLLLSDANGTALIANLGTGRVLGPTGSMQRHIDTNTGANGYRHYSSPVAGETLGAGLQATAGSYTPDFSGAAAYNGSATPGTVTPFPTVFQYNQDRIATTVSNFSAFDKGWEAPTSATAPMEVGRGYIAHAPGTTLVDFTGTFTTGPVARTPLNRTGPDGGWHLLGNPYPAPLDWSTLTLGAGQSLENMDGAVYVFQSSGPYAGSYRTYQNGIGEPLVPAGAGFFVRTTTPGTAGTLRLDNANRVTTFGAQPAFGRGLADTRPQLALTLTNATGALTDAATLYAQAGATAGLDAAYDAVKLANPSGLNLSALTATGEALAIDGRPAFGAATVVPLQVGVPVAGTYTLAITTAHLPAGLAAYLRDATTGQQQLLGAQFTATVALTAGLSTRYSIVFAPAGPLATAPGLTAAQVLLYPNPSGQAASVTVALPVPASTREAQAQVLNALGQLVLTARLSVQAGQATGTLSTTGLAAGVYVVRVQAGMAVVSKRLVVN